MVKKKSNVPMELVSLDFDSAKCPACGGPINQVWFITYDFITKRAWFLAQCWAGGVGGKDHYHIFRIMVPVNGEVSLGKEAEEDEE